MSRSRACKIVVITGVAGAGKSQGLKAFEVFGYFCVEDLPI